MPLIPIFAVQAPAFSITIAEGTTTGTFYLTPHTTTGDRDIAITTSPVLTYPGSPVTYSAGTFVANTLIATSGSYAETDLNATLKAASHLVSDTGSYAETGSSATLFKNPFLLAIAEGATTGIFYLTPLGTSGDRDIAITTTPALSYAGIPIVYSAIAGTNLLLGAKAVYGESVSSANTIYSGHVALATGHYVENEGNSITLTQRAMDCLTASYIETGTSANFKDTKSLSSATGSYAETGDDLTTYISKSLTGVTGSYGETGLNATLKKASHLSATLAEYALTGITVTTVWVHSGSFDLIGQTGHYTDTGHASILQTSFHLPSDIGDYAETESNSTLQLAKSLSGTTGSYATTERNATLKKASHLSATLAEYALTGITVTTVWGHPGAFDLIAQTGNYAKTGMTTSSTITYNLTLLIGEYVETGSLMNVNQLEQDYLLFAQSGLYTEASLQTNLDVSHYLPSLMIIPFDPFISTAEFQDN